MATKPNNPAPHSFTVTLNDAVRDGRRAPRRSLHPAGKRADEGALESGLATAMGSGHGIRLNAALAAMVDKGA